jgi:hypothetical protein
MALNIAITAVPASIVALILSAAVFQSTRPKYGVSSPEPLWIWPVGTAFFLTLLSQLALTLVIPHETGNVVNRCGLDEIKMAAYVGIAAFPCLGLALGFILSTQILQQPILWLGLLGSGILSLICLRYLIKVIYPKRASLPPPVDEREKLAAKWFGSIASARGDHLVELCLGCGWAMVMPLYVTVFSLMINMIYLTSGLDFMTTPDGMTRLFLAQAVVSMGLFAAAAVVLTIIYLFYMHLGRRFSRRNQG